MEVRAVQARLSIGHSSLKAAFQGASSYPLAFSIQRLPLLHTLHFDIDHGPLREQAYQNVHEKQARLFLTTSALQLQVCRVLVHQPASHAAHLQQRWVIVHISSSTVCAGNTFNMLSTFLRRLRSRTSVYAAFASGVSLMPYQTPPISSPSSVSPN